MRHVCVDPARAALPISGTRIRDNPHLYREFMHPAVYASFVERICLLGGESSGKTTLARALARRLDTQWVPEVGREYWEECGGTLGYGDMRLIAERQVAREDVLARLARQWLVCDGSALTTVFYSLDGFGRVDSLCGIWRSSRMHSPSCVRRIFRSCRMAPGATHDSSSASIGGIAVCSNRVACRSWCLTDQWRSGWMPCTAY